MEQKLSVLGIDIAKQGLHRHPFKLRDILRCACAQRARNGRLVGTRRVAKGPPHPGEVRIVTLLCAMVLAPQRMPTKASRSMSTGRYRTVFGTMARCSRRGAKKHCRRRYSPRAQRLARPVWRRVDFGMAHSFP
jgi:hypothetical protein